MGINGVEKAGISAKVANFNNIAPNKTVEKTEKLQELLSNSTEPKSADKNFFQEHKTLTALGGIFAVAVTLLGARKLNMTIVKNLAQKSREKFLQETREFIAKETEIFYKETQSYSKIYDFEKNKTLLQEAINRSPGEFSMTPKEHRAFIDFLKNNGLDRKILQKNIIQNNYYSAYCKLERKCKIDFWEKAKKIYYGQKELLNPDLIKIKSQISPRKVSVKEDLIQDYYREKGYTLSEVKRMLAESENITLESGSLLTKSNYRDEIYDLPFRFASASYNSLAKKGNAYIKSQIPELFKGIEEKELFECLDLLSTHIRCSSGGSFPRGSILNIKIGGKSFKCTSLGHGMEGSVYRISTEGQKPVILKTYFASNDHSPFGVSFAPSGLYGGLGILREANIANVVDVPKLYMANPIYTPIKGARSGYMGAWQLTEDANLKKAEEKGLRFWDWLKSRKLSWTDDKEEAWINGICIDTGFIINNVAREYLTYGWGDYGLNNIYSKYLNGETTRQILDFLRTIK